MVKTNKFSILLLLLFIVVFSSSAFANTCDTIGVETTSIGSVSITSATATITISNSNTWSGYVGLKYRPTGTDEWLTKTTQTFDSETLNYNFNLDYLVSNTQYEVQSYIIETTTPCAKYETSPELFTTQTYVKTSYTSNVENAYDLNWSTYATMQQWGEYWYKEYSNPIYIDTFSISHKSHDSNYNNDLILYVKYTYDGDWEQEYLKHTTYEVTTINDTIDIQSLIYGYKVAYTAGDGIIYEIVENSEALHPEITLGDVTEVTTTTAQLYYTLDTLGDYATVNVGVSYNEIGSSASWVDTCEVSTSIANTKTCSISGLDYDTTFEYKPYVEYVYNSTTYRLETDETSYFTTSGSNPLISTSSARAVDFDSATIKGVLESFGGSEDLECGFILGEDSETILIEQSEKTTLNSDIITSLPYFVNLELIDLEPETDYYFEFFCKDTDTNVKYYSFNDVQLFTTLETPDEVIELGDFTVDNIGSVDATFNLEIVEGVTFPIRVDTRYKTDDENDFDEFSETITNGTTPLSYLTVIENLEINTTYDTRICVYYGTSFENYACSDYLTFDTLTIQEEEEEEEIIGIVENEQIDEFFSRFTGNSKPLSFLVALVLIVGMFVLGFQITSTVIGGTIFGGLALVLSVVVGLIGVGVLILLGLVIIAPFLFKLFFGRS